MRRRRATIRKIEADPKYGDYNLAKFINRLMWNGKKSLAQRIVYEALEDVAKRANRDGLSVFNDAVQNTTPTVEVRARRVGGSTYQVPRELRTRRQSALAHRWLIDAARARKGRPMMEKLAQELFDASRGLGVAVKRKVDTHRMAEANRSFAQHRW